jgi:uncharacterized tellurite resistance protein B-like protein
MEPVARPAGEIPRPATDPAATIRGALRRLHDLDPRCARPLEALAFLLARVADADSCVSEAERARMEAVVAARGALPLELAVLLVEIATQRRRAADAGGSYRVSRELRLGSTACERQRLLSCLLEIAAADGVDPRERAELAQVAAELGFDLTDAVGHG